MKSTLLVAAESRIFREALCRLLESRPELKLINASRCGILDRDP